MTTVTPATEDDPRHEAAPVDGLRPPHPHLYRVLDCENLVGGGARHSLAEIDTVVLGRGAVTTQRRERERELEIRLADRWVSSAHAVVRRSQGRWFIEDKGSRNGTFMNGAPITSAVLTDGAVLEIGHTFFLFRDPVVALAGRPLDREVEPGALATLSASLERELEALQRVARTLVSVVLQGETGTGKEVIARALHAQSERSGAFVAVNCAALPDTLVETELFGYKKGAFSDAREDRVGLVRAADGGTLFLDEIGDLPLATQGALLRVLQEREVLPVGGTRPLPVDLRVCVASPRSLEELVATGRLRSDVHARLAGLTFRLPPLRQRREDLGLLVAALTRRLAAVPTKARLRVDTARLFFRHAWPMNIRELEKVLGVAFALAGEAAVEVSHLPENLTAARAAAEVESEADVQRRQELGRLLREHQGNISAVARALGKDRVQIRRWLKRYGMDPTGSR